MISFKAIGVFCKFPKGINSQSLLKKPSFNPNYMISSCLTLKAFRDPNYSRPPPFDYKRKSYLIGTPFYDRGLKRFDENTKFIVVEGNIGVGKTNVAKKIAEAFDFRYFPEVTMDMKYINDYGYDLRGMDPHLPERLQSVDVKRFYTNPYHKGIPRLQIEMYRYRYFQYIEALNHVLNSGQGVVLERSHFSDFVFAKTMQKFNYIRKEVLDLYQTIWDYTAHQLYSPHLVLYLDAPVDVLMERIKKRNIPYEVNSKVLTKEYLETLDHFYKQYLDNAKQKSVLKILDWTEPQDLDLLVLDIEKIDFDQYVKTDPKLLEWRGLDQTNETNMREIRRWLTVRLKETIQPLFPPTYNFPELWISPDEQELYLSIREQVPGEKYQTGFNADLGDEGIQMKTEKRLYDYKQVLFEQHPTI